MCVVLDWDTSGLRNSEESRGFKDKWQISGHLLLKQLLCSPEAIPIFSFATNLVLSLGLRISAYIPKRKERFLIQ
jgi:hypothetical protein